MIKRRGLNLEYMDERIVDKVKLLVLRGLLKLGGFREFLDFSGYFTSDEIAYFLGLEEFIDKDPIDRKRVRKILEEELLKLEKQKYFSTLPTLKKNIDRFAELLTLNETEKKILEFTALLHYNDLLRELSKFLGDGIDRQRLYKILAILLDEKAENIKKALEPEAKLVRSSLIKISSCINSLIHIMMPISEEFIDRLVNIDADVTELVKEWVRTSDTTELEISDFGHIKEDVHNILEYLKKCSMNKQEGSIYSFMEFLVQGRQSFQK